MEIFIVMRPLPVICSGNSLSTKMRGELQVMHLLLFFYVTSWEKIAEAFGLRFPVEPISRICREVLSMRLREFPASGVSPFAVRKFRRLSYYTNETDFLFGPLRPTVIQDF